MASTTFSPHRFSPTLLAAAVRAACLLAAWQTVPALAQTAPAGVGLKNTGPIELEADSLTGLPGKTVDAQGKVRARRGNLQIQADQLHVDLEQDRVQAEGHVQLDRGGDHFTGSQLDLDTSDYTGFLLTPTYRLARTQAGGKAARINFLGQNKLSAQDITYSSCTVAEGDLMPWELTASRLRADIDTNDGLAEGAVLRFYGVPILAAPVLTFPVTDERKSGWLPPQLGGASNSGLEVAVPYYWSIAPNRDMTLTPTFSSRRGPGLQTELRYLEADFRGEFGSYVLPGDKVAGRDRWALRLVHNARLSQNWFFDTNLLRVSDDAYWNDGLRGLSYSTLLNPTPRLLPSKAQLLGEQQVRFADTDVGQTVYARAVRYQALQGTDPTGYFAAPYRREPQVGVQWRSLGGDRLDWRVETEVNRFTHEENRFPTQQGATPADGTRLHSRGSVAWPIGDGGWLLTPKLQYNAATYSIDQPAGTAGPTSTSRFIPTASLDSQWFFERETRFFGRDLTQTLEPRLQYVRTPYRRQDSPLFDSAGLDFNEISIFSENAFSGVDRVSDANQMTGGLLTRFHDRNSGAELARLGVAQRYRFTDQLITPEGALASGHTSSDVLLYGTVNTVPKWSFSGIAQYNPDTERVTRTILSAVYNPGPFRTLSAVYRQQRDVNANANLNESLTLGWQWPLWGPVRSPGTFDTTPAQQAVRDSQSTARANGGGRECRGTFYGVGRVEYSLMNHRVANSIVGVEYDAGCWIGRFVVERTSTSLNTSTTKWWLQLELIGLSRLGSNPLSTLRDNVPGYRLLYDRNAATPAPAVPAATDSASTPVAP